MKKIFLCGLILFCTNSLAIGRNQGVLNTIKMTNHKLLKYSNPLIKFGCAALSGASTIVLIANMINADYSRISAIEKFSRIIRNSTFALASFASTIYLLNSAIEDLDEIG